MFLSALAEWVNCCGKDMTNNKSSDDWVNENDFLFGLYREELKHFQAVDHTRVWMCIGQMCLYGQLSMGNG